MVVTIKSGEGGDQYKRDWCLTERKHDSKTNPPPKRCWGQIYRGYREDATKGSRKEKRWRGTEVKEAHRERGDVK